MNFLAGYSNTSSSLPSYISKIHTTPTRKLRPALNALNIALMRSVRPRRSVISPYPAAKMPIIKMLATITASKQVTRQRSVVVLPKLA